MTISNSNLQSLLSISPEMTADSAAAMQTAAAELISEQPDGSLNEGEFWSMLSQQLTEITAQNDTQVIENKENIKGSNSSIRLQVKALIGRTWLV